MPTLQEVFDVLDDFENSLDKTSNLNPERITRLTKVSASSDPTDLTEAMLQIAEDIVVDQNPSVSESEYSELVTAIYDDLEDEWVQYSVDNDIPMGWDID